MASAHCFGAPMRALHRRRSASGSPPQPRGMDRRVPEALRFIIEQRNGERAAGHVERGHVVADQRTCGLQPMLLEELPGAVVEEIKLHRGRAAEAVDEEQRLAAL